ncbi:MAG: hypothetical protein IPN18_17615 [Ignavibacteriales bacterium]|nr:hypothetical protein [Ignavibacteriales bacterium]
MHCCNDFAFYLAVAQKQGVDFKSLRGTLQNDILKEYIAQKEYIYPPHPIYEDNSDMIEYCTKRSSAMESRLVIGVDYICEAGSTSVQELASTPADGFSYWGLRERGTDIDEFAPGIPPSFNLTSDFFEEIAKFRAARRIYAKECKIGC